jgi:hypothetical protein
MIPWSYGEFGSSFQSTSGSWSPRFSFCSQRLVSFEVHSYLNCRLTLASASVMIIASFVLYMFKLPTNAFSGVIESTIAVSILTNFLATSLIAYKLWLDTISSGINDDGLFLTGTTEKPPAISV